jgi:hypothetical protein
MRLFLFATASLVLCSGCLLLNAKTHRGSGVVITEQRQVEDFHGISASGNTNVTVKIGAGKSVTASFDDNLMEFLKTEVRAGILTIYVAENWSSSVGLNVEITMPALDDIQLSGASKVIADNATGENIRISCSGASSAEVSGTFESLKLDLSGASEALLGELTSKKANLSLSGASNATVNVSEFVEIDASGASRTTILGNPKEVKKDSSGASKVTLKD